MKLKIPLFQYEYEVTQNGIAPINKQFEDADDKILYYSILDGLNVDFKNAPIDIAYTNPLHQKVVYTMRMNQQYDIEVDEVLKIKSGQESLKPEQFAIMMQKMSPNIKKSANTDLQ